MKRILLCPLLLFALAFTLAACNSPAQPTEVPTEPPTEAPTEAPTEPGPIDPFTEEEYQAWFLAEARPLKDFYAAYDEIPEGDGIYHMVYNYVFREGYTPREHYRYDGCYTYTNEEKPAQPVYFRGDTALYFFDDYDAYDNPRPEEDTLINIQDPAIYGLLEEFVFSLTFEAGGNSKTSSLSSALFFTQSLDGTKTYYWICRDGVVYRGESSHIVEAVAATRKLPRNVTAAIYAVKHTFFYSAIPHIYYAREGAFDPTSREYAPVEITVYQNGQEKPLTIAESQEFLRLVSDPNEDENGDLLFSCFVRTNCGMGDRGEKLLDFTLYSIKSDGSTGNSITYSLYEDGKIVRHHEPFIEFPVPEIVDCLYVDHIYISRSNFDTQAILDFLNS